MIPALFLTSALALPMVTGFHAAPQWDFGQDDVKVIRLLRDYENGGTASRPQIYTLIYGQHPQWVRKLNEARIKTIGAWKERTRWPYYIQATPTKFPFASYMFQVYIYDDFPINDPPIASYQWVWEIIRVVRLDGFFLFRENMDGRTMMLLSMFGWKKFDFDWHEFSIWHKSRQTPQIDFVLEKAA